MRVSTFNRGEVVEGKFLVKDVCNTAGGMGTLEVLQGSKRQVPHGFQSGLVQDWQAAKLLKPSAIKPIFATLEQGLVIKSLGKLPQRDQQALKQMIGKILG